MIKNYIKGGTITHDKITCRVPLMGQATIPSCRRVGVPISKRWHLFTGSNILFNILGVFHDELNLENISDSEKDISIFSLI